VAPLLKQEMEWMTHPPAAVSPSELDQKFAQLRWQVASHLWLHDIPGAISYARASLVLDEAQPERWERLGDLYAMSGEVTAAADAANAYDNAVFLSPHAVQTRVKLSGALLALGQAEEAAKQLEMCLCQAAEEDQRKLLPVYTAACVAGKQVTRGAEFCRIMAEQDGLQQIYRVAWAILANAAGQRQEAVRLLTDVVSKEESSSPLGAYAASLKTKYETTEGGQR
jgi:predicted Zn-dependent protease